MSNAKAVRAAMASCREASPSPLRLRQARHPRRRRPDAFPPRRRWNEIQRLAHGVFVRPRTSRFVGTVPPDIHEVVEAIARSNGETVQIHGAEAARRFRLSTQVPTAPVFHTSASSRTLTVAGVTVRMIHTSNRRRLQYAGEATGAALSALWYLGEDNVTPETVATIEAALGPSEFEKLRSADMPAWMQKAFAGSHRHSCTIVDYRRETESGRRKALDELTAFDQDLGLQ